MKLLRYSWLVLGTALLVATLFSSTASMSAQDDTQSTVTALQTEVAELKTMVALQTEVADLRAQLTPEGESAATPTAVGETIVYLADASGGLNDFAVIGPWKKFDGMLVTDGTASGWAFAPYEPQLAKYAIEAEIQVVKYPDDDGSDKGFAVSNGSLFGGTFEDIYEHDHAGVWLDPDLSDPWFWSDSDAFLSVNNDFYPEYDWHTYRLELEGNSATLFVDGAPVVSTVDNQLLSVGSGRVGIWIAGQYQINVRSFKVIALEPS